MRKCSFIDSDSEYTDNESLYEVSLGKILQGSFESTNSVFKRNFVSQQGGNGKLFDIMLSSVTFNSAIFEDNNSFSKFKNFYIYQSTSEFTNVSFIETLNFPSISLDSINGGFLYLLEGTSFIKNCSFSNGKALSGGSIFAQNRI